LRLLVLLLALPLAACWTGDSFYAASDSRPALPPGDYKSVPTDRPADAQLVRVSIRGDGMTAITDRDGDHIMGFAPLGGPYFAMWFREDESKQETLYALFQAEGGRYRALIPFCDKTRDVAVAAGAQVVIDPKLTTCAFKTRAQLEDGLRRLEAQEIDAVDFIPTRRPGKPRPGPDHRPRPHS
jgi:hypothetical protein